MSSIFVNGVEEDGGVVSKEDVKLAVPDDWLVVVMWRAEGSEGRGGDGDAMIRLDYSVSNVFYGFN
jgi:hypothetical protein